MRNPTIYSFSVVYSSFGAFVDKVPYVVAILENEDHSRFPALITGEATRLAAVRIGQEVFPSGTNEKGETQYSL